MVNLCIVNDCRNAKIKTREENCTLFRIPKDLSRSKQWLINCDRLDLSNKSVEMLYNSARVCMNHFKANMFSKPEKNRLLESAVPTEFETHATTSSSSEVNWTTVHHSMNLSLPYSSSMLSSSSSTLKEQKPYSSTSTQTTKELTVNTLRDLKAKGKLNELNSKCSQLEKQVETLTKQINETLSSVNHFYCVCDAHLPPNLSLIVKSYVKMANRKPQGFRYINELKQLALTIYFFGPLAYQFLKTILQLPSTRTLRRITEKLDIVPGLNDVIFELLRFKLNNLKDDAKDCVLCIDEMSIKTHLFYNLSKDYIVGFNGSFDQKTYEPANYVLCFMLRSLNYSWKQPIAYYFINNSCTGLHLKRTIFAVISKIQSISFNVRVLTTDQGSNFIGFAKSMSVTPQRPYFFVNQEKIFYVFDVPHLLKSTRNNFFKYYLTFDNSTTEKKHLVHFYEFDQNIKRLAPKLTDTHINPNSIQKMKVQYASQVFSATVAAGMLSCVENGILSPTANTTIKFIDCMDKLFDILNSKPKWGSKDYNRPFKNTVFQRQHLLFMLNTFKCMHVLKRKIENGQLLFEDVTYKITFLNGWQITINSLLQLWDDINKPLQYSLCTYRLNQDCLENLFGHFRGQNGNNVNPTPIQFLWTFKKKFSLNFLKYSDGSNCMDDLDTILTNISEVAPTLDSTKLFSDKAPFNYNSLKVETVDYCDLCLPARNALAYVSGYLIKKCLEEHSCHVCFNYARNQNQLDNSFLMTYFKAYQNEQNSNYENLYVPPDQFFNYINELDNIFIREFPIIAVKNNVGKELKNKLDNVSFDHPCSQFDIHFLKNLYIRLRIFHSLKILNKNVLSAPRKNRRLDILSHL